MPIERNSPVLNIGQPHSQRLLKLVLRQAFKRAEFRKHVRSNDVELWLWHAAKNDVAEVERRGEPQERTSGRVMVRSREPGA